MTSCSTALLHSVSFPGILLDRKQCLLTTWWRERAPWRICALSWGWKDEWSPWAGGSQGWILITLVISWEMETFLSISCLGPHGEATAASWGLFIYSSTISPPGHQDLRIRRSLSCLRPYISYNSTWMQTSRVLSFLVRPLLFFSFHCHLSPPKPFPSICRILASLEIKSSKIPQTVHNLLSFLLPSLNILKPALHLAPLPPWRYQVGSLPHFVAQTLWFGFSTILPAHSSAHSPT